jgi:DNA-binding HxlR family transcriptional regulator
MQCGLAQAARLLGQPWALAILREAFYGVRRFEDMRTDLGAPRQALSARLAALVAAGLLEKRPYREPGQRPREEYVFSEAGRDLALGLAALAQWGDRHLTASAAPVAFVDRTSRDDLAIAFVTPEGRTVPPGEVRLKLRPTSAMRR